MSARFRIRCAGPIVAVCALAWTLASMDVRGLETDLERGLAAITPALIKTHVRFLSHDLLRGRNTGDTGYEIAREYVAAQFSRIGLRPISENSYLQPFELLVATGDSGSELQLGTTILRPPEATFAPDWTGGQPTITGDGVYVGFGIVTTGRNDYAGVDVNGKVVFQLAGLPAGWSEQPDRSLLQRLKNEIAIRRGAAAIVSLQIAGSPATGSRSGPMALADGTAPSFRPDVTVTGDAARRLLHELGVDLTDAEKLAESGAPPRQAGRVSVKRSHTFARLWSWNVIGILPGADAKLKDEAVVFTAHLDHVGVGDADETGDAIFNGTHDNALGIGKTLAAAEAMARLNPRRSIVFAAVGAEERGLLGSWYYVRHPAFPIERTAANINQDGGREDAAVDDVFAFGAEYSSLHEDLEQAARDAGMRLNQDTRPPFSPSQALLFRSDQYSFLLAGVPAMYLMDGYSIGGDEERGRREWDEYLKNVNHKQRDNFSEAWSFEAPARVAALSVRLGWRVANADRMPNMKPTAPVQRSRAMPSRPYFFAPDFTVK